MITEEQIEHIIKQCAEKGMREWETNLPKSKFSMVANLIYVMLGEKIMELKTERAELQAKVKAYEAIIENSNFKMAVQGTKEVKNETTK